MQDRDMRQPLNDVASVAPLIDYDVDPIRVREVESPDVSARFNKDNNISGKPKRPVIRSLMIAAALKITQKRSDVGLMAALSPTPHEFIELILSDEIFSKTFHRAVNPTLNENTEINDCSADNEFQFEVEGTVTKCLAGSDLGYQTVSGSSVNTSQPRPATLIANCLHRWPLHTMVDFGCGDGRWLIAFQRKFNCLSFGIEKDVERLGQCRQIVTKEEITCDNISGQCIQNKIELILGDFTAFCCTGISVAIVFLSRDGNEYMKDKLERECLEGTIIIAIGVSTVLYCTVLDMTHEHYITHFNLMVNLYNRVLQHLKLPEIIKQEITFLPIFYLISL